MVIFLAFIFKIVTGWSKKFFFKSSTIMLRFVLWLKKKMRSNLNILSALIPVEMVSLNGQGHLGRWTREAKTDPETRVLVPDVQVGPHLSEKPAQFTHSSPLTLFLCSFILNCLVCRSDCKPHEHSSLHRFPLLQILLALS